MADADYAALQEAIGYWARFAATPQYRQMVEVAREHARDQATARVQREALKASEVARNSIRREAARAVEGQRSLSREAIEQARRSIEDFRHLRVEAAKHATSNYAPPAAAAAALQPVLDQYIKGSSAWLSTVQRTFQNPQVLAVLQEWARLSTASSEGSQIRVTEVSLETLENLANASEVQEAELDAFDADLSEIDILDQLLDEAATSLVNEHPFITKAQARRIVVVVAYVGWLATLVGLGVATSPMVGVVALLLSGAGADAPKVSGAAGKAVNAMPERFFAPEAKDVAPEGEAEPDDTPSRDRLDLNEDAND